METGLSTSRRRKTGSINQTGFWNGLSRLGFTIAQCYGELVGNSIDAKADEFKFIVKQDVIRMVDDGTGMDDNGIDKMFDAFNENHQSESSIGISGIGSKASFKMLCDVDEDKKITCSEEYQIYVYTHAQNGPYLKITVPIGEMIAHSRYIDMIEIDDMNKDEKEVFMKERNKEHGTTIVVPKKQSLVEVLDENFGEIKDAIEHNHHRLSIAYGKFQMNIGLQNGSKPIKWLPKYNYFQHDDTKYYTGKHEYTIQVYSSKGAKFVLMDKDGETYMVKNNTVEKVKMGDIHDFRIWKKKGEFHIVAGQQKDKDYFDEDEPFSSKRNQQKLYGDDKKFFRTKISKKNGEEKCFTDDEKYLCHAILVRNCQVIGPKTIRGLSNSSSIRADAEARHKIYHTHLEISYNVISNQNNYMDDIVDIQQNKNQLNPSLKDKTLEKLLYHIKVQVHKKIWEFFNQTIHPNQQEPSIQDSQDNSSSESNSIQEELSLPSIEIESSPEKEIVDIILSQPSPEKEIPTPEPAPDPVTPPSSISSELPMTKETEIILETEPQNESKKEIEIEDFVLCEEEQNTETERDYIFKLCTRLQQKKKDYLQDIINILTPKQITKLIDVFEYKLNK